MLITEDYREQNRQLHANPEYGVSGAKWAGLVQDIVTANRCETVLDYGCGKRTLSKALPHLLIRNYDPCIPGLDTPPEPADLVVCGDVLEHIEPDCIDDVLDDLERLTNRVCFVVVATRPAKKTLPDGRNAHILLRDRRWWIGEFIRRFDMQMLQGSKGEFAAVLLKVTA